MRTAMASIAALLLATALLYLGAGQQGIIVPVRAGIEGFSTLIIGLFGTFYAGGFVTGCYIVPGMLASVGHVRSFAVMASLAAVSILLQSVLLNEVAWLVCRFITGFAIAGSAMIVESWLNERATNETRGAIFSVYMAINLLFVTAGQLSLMVLDPGTGLMFISGAICFCVALLPTSLSVSPAPELPKRAKLDLVWLYRLSPVASVGAFSVGLANGAFGSLGPVFARDVGLSYDGVAIFMSLALVAGAASQIVLGRVSDRMDRRVVIGSTAMVGVIAGINMAVFGAPGALVYVLVGGFGAVAYSLYGMVVAHGNDHADPSDFVAVAGGLLLLLGFGQVFGPAVAAFVAELTSTAGIFYFTAFIHAVLGGFTIYRMSQRRPVPARERGDFVDYGQGVSPEAVALDPRAEDVPETPGPTEAAVELEEKLPDGADDHPAVSEYFEEWREGDGDGSGDNTGDKGDAPRS